nr:LysM peptidoglycan-binding domain-containing protein [Candidatus Omnitrophota bacterium]
MLKFKKVFNAKIVSLLMAVLFLLNSTVYGIDLPKNTLPKLRVPVVTNNEEGKRRLTETLNEITYHDHINNHIASQAQAQYQAYLKAEKLEDNPENLQKFYNNLSKYKNTGIAIMEIKGLYENTKILEHIGLGRFYGKPVIYIDSSLKDKDKEEILKHAYDEMTGWDNTRDLFKAEWNEMRNLILIHYTEFQEIADEIHDGSNNIDNILKKYGAQHKSDLLTVIASMPFKEGDVAITAGISRRDFLKLGAAALLAYYLYRTRLLGLIGYSASYPKSIPEELIPYMIVGIDEIPNDNIEGYVKKRLWTKPENVRALTDASHHFNIPRVLAVSVLSTEIFAMDSGVRRDQESVISTLHGYDTFSEGIAQLQVRHAVRFFPALYEDAMAPGAPSYLKEAIEPYAYLSTSIGERDKKGALIHFKEIKEILKNDVLCIYMMTMYIREAMAILHESDPSFRDPDTLDAFSIPTAFEAGAVGSYYVYGPPFALNPSATSVWDRIVGRDISVPDYNIYKISVHQNGWNWLELDKYLKQDGINGISMESAGHRTFSEVMNWMADVWAIEHATPYDPGLFGLVLTNKEHILAQQIPPQYAYMARMFAHSDVYGFNIPYSYPNNWQASQAPAMPMPQSTPPPVFVGDLPEGFSSDTQGIFYTVQEGDSLWNIATRVFNELNHLYPNALDINYILDNIIIPLNPDIIDRNTIIHPGQKIYVYSFAQSSVDYIHRHGMMSFGYTDPTADLRKTRNQI